MEKVPVYWKTTLKDVEETLQFVKKGKVSHAATSAGGRPIYMVEYGVSNLPKGTANLSSALGAADPSCYANKSGADYNPTVFLVGCVHGGEFEGTCAILNLMKLLETGTDYAGNPNEELVELCEKTHLILIPLANPDGRRRDPGISVGGRTMEQMRYYDQGTWKDGSLADWPDCKKVHPIKDHVEHLGSYFDDDGVNMMHENFFGKVSTGTRLILDICASEAPDFSILLHGGTGCINHMLSPAYASLNTKQEIVQLDVAVEKACLQANVRHRAQPLVDSEKNEIPPSFNLISAMHHCCGAPAVTYESNQAPDGEDVARLGGVSYSYEEIYKAHCILFGETMRYYLKKFHKM